MFSQLSQNQTQGNPRMDASEVEIGITSDAVQLDEDRDHLSATAKQVDDDTKLYKELKWAKSKRSPPTGLRICDLPLDIQKDALAFDDNGDGFIDTEEYATLLKKQINTAANNRLLVRICLALVVALALTICTLTGTTFAVVQLSKDTRVADVRLTTNSGATVQVSSADICYSSNGATYARNSDGTCPSTATSQGRKLAAVAGDLESGRFLQSSNSVPILMGNTDLCVSADGVAVARDASGGCPTVVIPSNASSASNVIKTGQASVVTFLTSDLSDSQFDSMQWIKLLSPKNNTIRVNVDGYIRYASESGSVGAVKLLTSVGEIILNGYQITYSNAAMDTIFASAGFDVSSRRLTHYSSDASDASGVVVPQTHEDNAHRKLVTTTCTCPPPSQCSNSNTYTLAQCNSHLSAYPPNLATCKGTGGGYYSCVWNQAHVFTVTSTYALSCAGLYQSYCPGGNVALIPS